MILSHAAIKRLQETAMRNPLRSGNDVISAYTNRDRYSGFAVLLSVNY